MQVVFRWYDDVFSEIMVSRIGEKPKAKNVICTGSV